MTSTAKNYAGQNLRGRSFKGQDLSGSDFSGADLRGADFTDAILRGANFSKVKTGVQEQWLLLELLLPIVIAIISARLAQTTAGLISATLLATIEGNPPELAIVACKTLILVFSILTILFIAHKGLTLETLATVVLAIAITTFLAWATSLVNNISTHFSHFGTPAIGLLVGVSTGIIGACSAILGATSVVAMSSILSGIMIVVIPYSVFITIGLTGNVDILNAQKSLVQAINSISLGTLTLLGIYIARKTLQGDPKFALLLKFVVTFAAFGGTSFRGADLSRSNFTGAVLKSCDFSNSRQKTTNLTCTILKEVQKLDRSRLGTSILVNPEVRDLLVTGKPNQSKSYEGLNFRGANLDKSYLREVNFKRAILSEASLRYADLQGANLTEVQTVGTDFTGVRLTGACLESWNYDATTKLDNVECDFVFELEYPNAQGSRERRPHDFHKNFSKGYFTKLYSELLNSVQLLIRDGINPEAFHEGWVNATKDSSDITFDNIQEIRKKGHDVELTVAVPEGTDKSNFESNFDNGYAVKLLEIEARYKAELKGKDAEIDSLRQNVIDIKEILQITKSSNINFSPTFQTEAKAVAEQNPVTIKAGRDISGNVINLGEIKGNVTNAINQIPNKEDSGDIKTLLTQLQEAISADKDLADEDKADALEQVENLAKITLHDKPAEKSTLASKAIRALKRIIDNIPTISKIVETVGKALGLA